MINFPRDMFDLAMGRRSPLIPPRGLWFVGGEEGFEAINEEFLGYFVRLGGLQPPIASWTRAVVLASSRQGSQNS